MVAAGGEPEEEAVEGFLAQGAREVGEDDAVDEPREGAGGDEGVGMAEGGCESSPVFGILAEVVFDGWLDVRFGGGEAEAAAPVDLFEDGGDRDGFEAVSAGGEREGFDLEIVAVRAIGSGIAQDCLDDWLVGVEDGGVADGGDDGERRMIAQAGADALGGVNRFDPETGELLGGADARAEQDGW